MNAKEVDSSITKLRQILAMAMVVTVGLVTVPLESEPAQAAAVGPQTATSVKLTQSCTTGNFTGEADVTTTFTPNGDGNNWTTTVDRYRITRLNGQSGGNKANVNLDFYLERGGVGWELGKTVPSADAMIQDGAWHNLGTSGTIQNVPLELQALYNPGYAVLSGFVSVRFIFDKSGSDPSCVATKTTDWGRDMKDLVAVRNQAKLEDPITYCMAVTGGGTCSISQTDTKSSTLTVEGGISYGWATAKISYNWTTSTAVRVTCSSPVLATGQQFWAYPTGTRYTFSTSARFFGQQVRVAPGSAFEVDGGVACATITPRAYTSGQ